jgi:Tfp pilus assembly protein PilF
MLWSDLARHFASYGDRKRANRCMKVALQLAPDHRWMLRTASRFLAHQDDPIAAHKLLANHPRTRHDPWLIAAELACSQVAERSPKYWRQANDILRFNRVAPLHISELATAVAMMELEGGERKKARKHIQKGLEAPTENTLAQLFWARENKHLSDGYELDQLVRTAEDAYEADYRLSLLQGNLPAALRAAEAWASDEPFAARPRTEIAFVASLLDNHDLTVKMAHAVHRLQGQSDPTLEMNAVFATLSSSKLTLENDSHDVDKLRFRLVRAIEQRNDGAYHAMANLGLWHYRFGDQDLGRELYQKSIGTAEKLHMLETAAMAATFAAREAILARDPVSTTVLQQARGLSKRSKNTASEFYLRKLDALSLCTERADEILSPTSAQRFLKLDKPTPVFGVEKHGKGLVLIVPKKK